MSTELKTVDILGETDVAYASLDAKHFAEAIGFSKSDQCLIATAVSELARNIFVYAKTGKVILKRLEQVTEVGMEVVAQDFGPGIGDVEKAMQDNYSTAGTMGVGLPGTQRLMDEFELSSEVNRGTKVTIRKWL
jgi:serine/threonine-protein kinase RsbT